MDIEKFKDGTVVNKLNSYIENNSDGIDTTGWCKWIEGEDGYPILDYNTSWQITQAEVTEKVTDKETGEETERVITPAVYGWVMAE